MLCTSQQIHPELISDRQQPLPGSDCEAEVSGLKVDRDGTGG